MNIVNIEGLEYELRDLLNRYSRELPSCTPDYILARYLVQCLEAFDAAYVERRKWYSGGAPEEKPSTMDTSLMVVPCVKCREPTVVGKLWDNLCPKCANKPEQP